MKALAHDIRKLLADRIQSATIADLFSLASSLCANDEAGGVKNAPAGRFTKLNLFGYPVSNAAEIADWAAVHDAETNLIWTRKPLECGAVNWKDAMKAASNYRLFGEEDWRAPTVKERVSIVNYEKFDPALYPEFEAGGASYEWTSTVDAEDPSDCAWVVYLRYGAVSRVNQTYHDGVRAVRAGQPLSLGL